MILVPLLDMNNAYVYTHRDIRDRLRTFDHES